MGFLPQEQFSISMKQMERADSSQHCWRWTFEPLEKLRQEFFAWKEGNSCSQRNETKIDVEEVPVTEKQVMPTTLRLLMPDAAGSSAAKVSSSYLVAASIFFGAGCVGLIFSREGGVYVECIAIPW